MTTTILDRVPVEHITEQAREVRFTRTLLALTAGILFGFGWLVAKFFGAAWLVLAWCAVAAREGWREGRHSRRAMTG